MNRNEDNSYKGFVLSESLNYPVILNNFEKIYVKIEEHKDSSYPSFWHLFKIKVPEDNVINTVYLICENLKDKWYAHLWNNQVLYVCFVNKSFIVKRHLETFEENLNKVKDYAEGLGIDRRYLDFWIDE